MPKMGDMRRENIVATRYVDQGCKTRADILMFQHVRQTMRHIYLLDILGRLFGDFQEACLAVSSHQDSIASGVLRTLMQATDFQYWKSLQRRCTRTTSCQIERHRQRLCSMALQTPPVERAEHEKRAKRTIDKLNKFEHELGVGPTNMATKLGPPLKAPEPPKAEESLKVEGEPIVEEEDEQSLCR